MSTFKQKLSLLPQKPGCYLMKDQDNLVIYVGKAKKLKNRVRSYFVGAHNEKTTRLVSEIRDFDYILTHSEQESLILELNLIKQYSPKYNIRLMDDKTYPYIQLTEEAYPKLEVVRDKTPKGRVFGPYPNVYSARETVRMLNRIYPLRKCDVLVVPIMASVFDEAVSRKFIIALQQIKKFRDVEIRLIPVGSRVNLRRRETTLLCDFMK